MYVKFDQLIDKIKELVILGRDMIVLKDQGEAEKAAIVTSGVINPALDGLKMKSKRIYITRLIEPDHPIISQRPRFSSILSTLSSNISFWIGFLI